MITRASFAQHLMGSFAVERPPFFRAYVALWGHLAVGAAVLHAVPGPLRLHQLASVAVGSFCLAIVVYGAAWRARGRGAQARCAWLAIGSYLLVMGRLFHPTRLDAPLQAAAVVAALACAHALLVREYHCWLAQTPAGAGHGAVPAWITASLVAAVILLCAVGVGLR